MTDNFAGPVFMDRYISGKELIDLKALALESVKKDAYPTFKEGIQFYQVLKEN